MAPRLRRPAAADAFDLVKAVGLTLPDVEATIKYDGSPVLKAGGCFMAGLASHRSAEPGTLVVRIGLEERGWLLEDAPDTSGAGRPRRAARSAVHIAPADARENPPREPAKSPPSGGPSFARLPAFALCASARRAVAPLIFR